MFPSFMSPGVILWSFNNLFFNINIVESALSLEVAKKELAWVGEIFVAAVHDQGCKFAFVFKCECEANATASQNANANAMKMRRLCEFWMRMRSECVAFFRIRILAFSHFSANRKMRICENANANRKMRNATFFYKKMINSEVKNCGEKLKKWFFNNIFTQKKSVAYKIKGQ